MRVSVIMTSAKRHTSSTPSPSALKDIVLVPLTTLHCWVEDHEAFEHTMSFFSRSETKKIVQIVHVKNRKYGGHQINGISTSVARTLRPLFTVCIHFWNWLSPLIIGCDFRSKFSLKRSQIRLCLPKWHLPHNWVLFHIIITCCMSRPTKPIIRPD